jgi:hypothetical protein
MTSNVLTIEDFITPDRKATRITEFFIDWNSRRRPWLTDKEEIRRYIYATDTTQTSNSKLPWKNKTTIPKICQIRDNLLSNYLIATFPQRKNTKWEANAKDPNSKRKRDAIENYMSWSIDQPSFKHEIEKVILDYIDFGNAFATVEWVDERIQHDDRTTSGYVGPAIRRISPIDMVMNPTAENFENSPKIVRSITSLGELKEKLERMSNDQNREEYETLWKYLKDVRTAARDNTGDWTDLNGLYQMDGFSTFREYLNSDYCEVLTFYGDLYDPETDELLKNHVITVVDRHKLIGCKPNPSFFGTPPIYHVSWRQKQDNLWGMGPLDNLIGMQYKLDHLENMRADIMDLVTYPVQKIRGFVEEYTWQPGEKIFVSEEGDVELVQPDVNVLMVDNLIEWYMNVMELMAGAPKEAMGFRTPGEKTKYEVQSLENAASRVFQNKIKQFEEQLVEKLLNAMLELSRRNMVGVNTIKVFDTEFGAASFQDLTVEDITGVGRIKAVSARHFAEQAMVVQNLTALAQSNVFPLVQPHMSGKNLAKMLEGFFNVGEYEIFLPFVGLAEQAEAQQLMQAYQEHAMQSTMTASGMGDDFDLSQVQGDMNAIGVDQAPEV